MPRIQLALICWLFLLPGPASGAPELPRLARQVELRLSSLTDVRAVATDGETTWAATTGGLLRVAGQGRITRFGSDDGLPPGRLHALLVEASGKLWVGGDGGLVQLDTRGTRLRVLERVPLRQVRALARYQERLFAGTWDQGLHSLGGGEKVARRHGPLLEAITALCAAPEGLYVASAGRGLRRFDGKRLHRVEVPSSMIWALALEPGRLWVGAMTGLTVLEAGGPGPLPVTLPVPDVRALLAVPGSMLVGSFGGGVHRLSRAEKRPARLAGLPATARIWALARGPEGLVAGTSSGLYLERAGGFVRIAPEGPPSNDISALAASRAGLWVGTFEAGLALYDRKQDRWRSFDHQAGLIEDWINHLAVQQEGEREILWVATPRGVSRFDGQRWQSFLAGQELVAGHVNAIKVSGPRVYFASSKGISIYQAGRWQQLGQEQGLPLRSVTSLEVGAGGELWVGGMNGLARYQQGVWQSYQVATGELPDDWVTALSASPEGIWVGTYNRGLAFGPRPWRQWTEGSGMPCGWVNAQALRTIEGRLWVGTMEGGLLVLSSAASGGRPRWEGLLEREGLPSADVTSIEPAGAGRVWVGTRSGLVLLGPESKTP